MKVFLCLVFLMCLYLSSEAKVYTNCELHQIFRETGLSGYKGHSAQDWLCLAFHGSSYNTVAVNDNGPGRNYGVLQISSKQWCNDGKTDGAVNGCEIGCQRFLDPNISDDIECAKRIVKDPNGISAWDDWNNHCKGNSLSKYTAGC